MASQTKQRELLRIVREDLSLQRAISSHYTAVKKLYVQRRTNLVNEIAALEKRIADLDRDYSEADDRLATSHQKILGLQSREHRIETGQWSHFDEITTMLADFLSAVNNPDLPAELRSKLDGILSNGD